MYPRDIVVSMGPNTLELFNIRTNTWSLIPLRRDPVGMLADHSLVALGQHLYQVAYCTGFCYIVL